ncbi:hypothetical protein CKO51_26365 [Rhodopirellula sp. SM50]|nr:hypothetical protein CKO51_26365 [Rhodopirellula sp. SM50]
MIRDSVRMVAMRRIATKMQIAASQLSRSTGIARTTQPSIRTIENGIITVSPAEWAVLARQGGRLFRLCR